MGSNARIDLPDLLDAMKRSAEALRTAGIPFALCGGLAVYARGGTASDHDVDFLITEDDAERCLETLTAAGLRTGRPPEDWLVKAWHDDVLIDLIFRPVERPVTRQTFAETDELPLAAIRVPVVSGTELLIHGLLTLTPQECNLSNALLMVRTIREQIDFDRVREETKGSPYARAFLFLAEELNLIGTEVRDG
ncbi:MAG: hypothetical protein ACM30G_12335 [Micromonosporaceae bacterium]